MKSLLFFLLIIFACLASKAQVRHRIAKGQTTIPYLQSQPGVNAILQNIKINIEYFGAGLSKDDSINFVIANATNAAIDPVITNPLLTIPQSAFTIDKKDTSITLIIRLNAVPNLAGPESFDIHIAGVSDTAHCQHHVVINNVPVNQQTGGSSAEISYFNPKGDTTNLPPFIKDKEAKISRQCKIKYKVSEKLSSDSIITIKMETPSGSSIKAELVTKSFIIRKTKTPTAGPYDSVYINFDISAQKDFGDDEYIYLSFENTDNTRDVICFTRRELINPNKPFWIEIGANLDLVDGLAANNFFTGVFFYKRDLKKFYNRKNKKIDSSFKNNNISIFAGVYESKTSSDSAIGNGRESFRYFDRGAINLIRNDSFPVFTDTGSLHYKTVTRNVSLFFSPSIRLTNGSANMDGLHIFASIWTELLWSRKSIITNGDQLNRKDTIFVPGNQLKGIPGAPFSTNKFYDYRTQYFGIGLPIYMKDNDVNLFVNPIFGVSNQRDIPVVQTISNSDEDQLFLIPKHKWNPFYIAQFRLSEEKFGFAFTGEIRGFMLQNSKPQISMALTKKFDLNKFLEYK